MASILLSAAAIGDEPSERDDEVFLLASYIARTEDVRPIEAITRAAGIQYGWGGELAHRLRTQGDIQTYALIPVWARIGGFEVERPENGRALHVTSDRIQVLSLALFVVSVFTMYWSLLPLGRGVALASALLVLAGHPFRRGPTLFDPWVMPLAIASVGWWLRDRHWFAIAAASAAILVKPNYVFLLPAFLIACMVPSGRDEPDRPRQWRAAAMYAAAGAAIAVAYLLLAALDVIAVGEYAKGVRRGYDPGVLAYSAVETLSYWYRAGVQQFRTSWPSFPWTVANAAVLLLLAVRTIRTGSLRRVAVLLAALLAIPVLANFTVLESISVYEDGGHFRWINVSILAMAMALPLAYREAARVLRR